MASCICPKATTYTSFTLYNTHLGISFGVGMVSDAEHERPPSIILIQVFNSCTSLFTREARYPKQFKISIKRRDMGVNGSKIIH